MKTIYELQQTANRLRQVTEVGGISPEDTFGLVAEVLNYMADAERSVIGVRKVYASIGNMNLDGESPKGFDGQPLRHGQLVGIYNADNPNQTGNGNVYAWQPTGESKWKLVGNLNRMEAADDFPTTGSNNLVKSGGVRSQINNLRQQFRGFGTGPNDTIAYYRGLDPVFYCGTFTNAYHGEYVEAIMNAELDKLHGPSGSSSDTYECNALEPELHGVLRPIPGGLCHINMYGSHIWFINNVRSYSQDLWVQIFFNAKVGLIRYEEDGEIKTKKGITIGQNIVIRTRIKANDSDEMYTLWGDFYEIPYNIGEKLQNLTERVTALEKKM